MPLVADANPLEPTLTGAVLRRKWMVIALVVLGVVASFTFASITETTEYQAVASIVVEDPRSSILFDIGNRQRRSDYVADQIEILRSGAVAERAARLASQDTPIDLTTQQLLENTTIIGNQDSSLIFISVRLEAEDRAVAGATAMIEAYAEFLREETEASFASSIQVLDETIASLRTEVASTRLMIDDINVGDNPAREALDEQIDAIVTELATLLDRLSSPSQTTRETAREEVGDVLLQLQVINEIASLESTDPDLAELLLVQARVLERIDDLSERRDRIVLDSQLLSSGVTAAIPAIGAAEVSPDLIRIVAVGAFLGLLLGTTISYGLALRRRNVGDRSQPEIILNAPLIAEVPTFRQEGIKTPIPVRTDPRSASAEAFRFAAAALQLAHPAGPRSGTSKSVSVVSAAIGEGKTVIAVNTALAAALEGSRVLLIDADFGNQMATALLSPDAQPQAGITEVVEAGVPLAEAVVTIEGGDQSGLHLLSRGWRRTTAPEFFRLQATRAFLQQVREFYDLVLIDGPPILQVAYASTLAGLADTTLVVVPHGGSLSSVEDLQDRLDLIGTPTVGYVYNLAPLRLEMTRTEGSMKDVLGKSPAA